MSHALYDPADVDDLVVDRILNGDWRLKCTASEKAEVCRRWVRNGGSLNMLGKLTGWATHRYFRVGEMAS